MAIRMWGYIDNEIERLFSIFNKQYDEACVVCTPDNYVNDFLKSKFSNAKVLLAFNVRQDQKSKSVLMESTRKSLDTPSSGRQRKTTSYYGDSMRWDVPSNLTHMVEPLLCKLGIQLNLCAFNQKNQST